MVRIYLCGVFSSHPLSGADTSGRTGQISEIRMENRRPRVHSICHRICHRPACAGLLQQCPVQDLQGPSPPHSRGHTVIPHSSAVFRGPHGGTDPSGDRQRRHVRKEPERLCLLFSAPDAAAEQFRGQV